MACRSLSRALALALGALTLSGCFALGTVLPPANRPARGPSAMAKPDRYDSHYNQYKFQEGYSMEGGRQFERALWAHLGGLRLGILFGSVTMPLFATGEPVGPVVLERSSSCLFWVCWDDRQSFRQRQTKLGAVSTVDARVTSVLFGIYSKRTLVMRGSVTRGPTETLKPDVVAPPPTPAEAVAPEVEAKPVETPVEPPAKEPEADQTPQAAPDKPETAPPPQAPEQPDAKAPEDDGQPGGRARIPE